MATQSAPKLARGKNLLFAVAKQIAAAILIFCALNAHAQSPTSQSQKTAAGKMEFEVASVRQTSPGSAYAGNVDLDPSDYFLRYTGGLMTTTGELIDYIIFAYKIDDANQYPLINAQLPKWAQTEQFFVEARPTGDHPTKDQLRLMMQSLLADRFKLAVHTDLRQLPVYALVLDKPGVPGPGLQPHPDDQLCTKIPDKTDKPAPKLPGSKYPPICELILFQDHGQTLMRMMDFTMPQIAGSLLRVGMMEGLDSRTILDQTGLTGKFDINVEYLHMSNAARSPDAASQPEEPGATFIDALKKQAGLKLIKQTGPVEVYVIDHVEPPSEN